MVAFGVVKGDCLLRSSLLNHFNGLPDIAGKIGGQRHPFSRFRVIKRNGTCVKGLSVEQDYIFFAAGVQLFSIDRGATAVEFVAQHRTPDVGHVDADLVCSASFGFHFHRRKTTVTFDHFVK